MNASECCRMFSRPGRIVFPKEPSFAESSSCQPCSIRDDKTGSRRLSRGSLTGRSRTETRPGRKAAGSLGVSRSPVLPRRVLPTNAEPPNVKLPRANFAAQTRTCSSHFVLRTSNLELVEVIGLEPTTPCVQSRFFDSAETPCFRGLSFQRVTAIVLSLVVPCGSVRL